MSNVIQSEANVLPMKASVAGGYRLPSRPALPNSLIPGGSNFTTVEAWSVSDKPVPAFSNIKCAKTIERPSA